MGRTLKRVPLDFNWPMNKPWAGYLNPHYDGHCTACPVCGGTGSSPQAKRLHDRWYGAAAFDPAETGSAPFQPQDPAVWAHAKWNALREYDHGVYQTTTDDQDRAIQREAERLCDHYNGAWCHHLDQADVNALIAAHRLWDVVFQVARQAGVDYRSDWRGNPWHRHRQRKRIWSRKRARHRLRLDQCHNNPAWLVNRHQLTVPARLVNEWTLTGFGHDSCNQWIVCRAVCERHGWPTACAACAGSGSVWDTPANQRRANDWRRSEPPTGTGYQLWETVSEGSPISPVFATPEQLADWLVASPDYRGRENDQATTRAQWLKFIVGPGWSPSFVAVDGQLMSGVQAVSA